MKIFCGETVCEACGDCLACYAGNPCHETKSGYHVWPSEEVRLSPTKVVSVSDGKVILRRDTPTHEV